MKRILIVGESPLPNHKSQLRTATSLRTWHFLQPLLKLPDYEITLLSINHEQQEKQIIKQNDDFIHFSIPKIEKLVIRELKKIMRLTKFKAVVGVNNYPSYLIALIKPKIPFWADLNGWLMSEGQAQAAITQNDSFLPFLWQREKKILLAADKISTVSIPQKYAIFGELASLGRLNSQTNMYDFIEVIPNATEKFITDESRVSSPLFRGVKIPKNAFVVAFIGGYNTWVDEDTLFKGLELSIKKNPNIYFVSTGGGLHGLNNKTFQRFQKLINTSVYKKHFYFLGWVKTEEMSAVYAESDCGINVDKLCVETLTGARNRINEMLKLKLPVITTLGSEIAEDVQNHKLGLTVQSGDSLDLANAILKLVHDDDLCFTLAQSGYNYAMKFYSYQKTIQPLIQWLKNSQKAPLWHVNLNKRLLLKAGLFYLKQKGIGGVLKKLKNIQ